MYRPAALSLDLDESSECLTAPVEMQVPQICAPVVLFVGSTVSTEDSRASSRVEPSVFYSNVPSPHTEI